MPIRSRGSFLLLLVLFGVTVTSESDAAGPIAGQSNAPSPREAARAAAGNPAGAAAVPLPAAPTEGRAEPLHAHRRAS